MEKILIFDASQKKRGELTECVRSCLDRMGTRHVEFKYFIPEDVFTEEIPEKAKMAFFTLENMTNAEAARKFGQFRKDIPLVIVCDDDEYAGESWSYGTKYYLTFPLVSETMNKAIKNVGIGGKHYDWQEKL